MITKLTRPWKNKHFSRNWRILELCCSSLTHSPYLYCASKQLRSYFGNEAIKQIQNEHNPLVNQHMAMSFACLWISNLWGEFLQLQSSMLCSLCFKHSKQTKQKHLGSTVASKSPSLSITPLSAVTQLSDDLQLTGSYSKRPSVTTNKEKNKLKRCPLFGK